MKHIELLAPARNEEIGREAILHGADAVYIGPQFFGARQQAANSFDDIKKLCDFAHRYRARVYATVNTLIFPNELIKVEKLISELYKINVDALIVQDLGILRLDIPPIELHASTQCDNRTPEQFQWLSALGFSQIVAARELSVEQLKTVCNSVSGDVKVEAFIHGALCVCYSGRCAMGYVTRKRSGNRGECPQMCRLPYDVIDASGKSLAPRAHWLSLKDLNATDMLSDILNAGVSSLKIEGRLKDAAYVKNVTAHYSKLIDSLIATGAVKGKRTSVGRSEVDFTPDINRSFNRTYSTYMLKGVKPAKMAATLTPKSIGEEITNPSLQLVAGDGVAWLNKEGNMEGASVCGVYPNGEIKFAPHSTKPDKNARIWRSSDIRWQKLMQTKTAVRKINIDIKIDLSGIIANDERGLSVRIPLNIENIPAEKPYNPKKILSKLGGTIYNLRKFENNWPIDRFIPNSILADARRNLTDSLDRTAEATYRFGYRRKENLEYKIQKNMLITSANVSNNLADEVYTHHGVNGAKKAIEVELKTNLSEPLMRCAYCILHEMGQCRKFSKSKKFKDIYLSNGRDRFLLKFDCENCQMLVYNC